MEEGAARRRRRQRRSCSQLQQARCRENAALTLRWVERRESRPDRHVPKCTANGDRLAGPHAAASIDCTICKSTSHTCLIIPFKLIIQSVSHYHAPNMELMDHTHSTVLFYFEYGDYLCNVVFLSLSLVFRQGPHLRMVFFFPSLFTFAAYNIINRGIYTDGIL